MNSLEVSDPLVAEKTLAVKTVMDHTLIRQRRVIFNELCVYQVKDEKIVS